LFGFKISFGAAFLGVNQAPLSVWIYDTLFGVPSPNPASRRLATTIHDGANFGVEALSSEAYVTGSLTSAIVQSGVNKVDSDNDGLTDYEEFFLHTNPVSKDSDEDGIDDFTEHVGYSLGHQVGGKELGIIKTDPLDADTDNDKRSDGEEAELKDIEQNRWVVRVDGQTPYRAFSNPLVADADFDGLVDGDEFVFDAHFDNLHSDPNNGNTDGDARDDGKEFGNTNPLIEDFQVTVYYSSIHITTGGDGSGNPGDFGFDLGIRRPDNSQLGGLSNRFTSIVQSNVTLSAPFHSELNRNSLSELERELPACEDAGDDSLCNNGVAIGNSNNNFGIPLNNNDTLQFRSLLTDDKRSRSFGMTKNDFFALEGVIVQDNASNADTVSDRRVYLGGLEGLRANDLTVGGPKFRPVFYGLDLIASASRFHDVTFNFTADDNQAGEGTKIAGSVTVLFVVS
jgi:hypothetical protein